jgi:hypothetical protein
VPYLSQVRWMSELQVQNVVLQSTGKRDVWVGGAECGVNRAQFKRDVWAAGAECGITELSLREMCELL